MSENCSHDCANCASKCDNAEKTSFLEPQNEMSNIKNVIAVVSGKGGVGKSLVTSLLATVMKRRDYQVGILDADVTGPSIPKTFGIKGRAQGDENGLYPAESATGVKVMSVNLLLENDSDPVVWRGPVIAGIVKQFWSDVVWGDVDFMFVDMPPGTGDVPLTVFQSLPVDGIIVVTSPQELVGMIVEKAVKMAGLLNVPVLGVVENMSYFECPDCHGKHSIFGESRIDETAKKLGVDTVSRIPINPKLAAACDKGAIELFEGDWLDNIADKLEKI
jgi:Mrp family chromosome partitioning ATPase